MNVLENLVNISKSPQHASSVKRYLIDCCLDYERYWPSNNLKLGMMLLNSHMKGFALKKDLMDFSWTLEGETFGIEYYYMNEFNFQTRVDPIRLQKIRHFRFRNGMSQNEAAKFLMDLGYFVDSVFYYIAFPGNELPAAQYEKFLSENKFNKYFGQHK